jgi:hypothetical protein
MVKQDTDVMERPDVQDDDVLGNTAATKVAKIAAKAVKDGGEATFDQLMKKPRRVLTFTVYSLDDDGEEIALNLKYQAVPSKQYDQLQSEHPPSAKEKRDGAIYNVDTFAPALISAVSVVPKLSVEQATELYHSTEWSGGEIATMFLNALRVCNAGLDVPFNERG